VDFAMSAGDVTMKPILQKTEYCQTHKRNGEKSVASVVEWASAARYATVSRKSVASVAAADRCDTFLQFPSLIGAAPFFARQSSVGAVFTAFSKLKDYEGPTSSRFTFPVLMRTK
jgi:hypothetical protein